MLLKTQNHILTEANQDKAKAISCTLAITLFRLTLACWPLALNMVSRANRKKDCSFMLAGWTERAELGPARCPDIGVSSVSSNFFNLIIGLD